MPITSPFQVTVDDADRAVLAALTRRATAAYRQVLRARIVLAAADGDTNAAIAAFEHRYNTAARPFSEPLPAAARPPTN